jgi:hypothetical protein
MDGVDLRPPPEPARSAAAAQWLASRLDGGFGAVCRTVPSGYAAYARVLHPPRTGADEPVRWRDVARANGRSMHALAQFDRIAVPAAGRSSSVLDVDPPRQGDLEPEPLRALSAVLVRHTPAGAPCWFALWEGWGELSGGTALLSSASMSAAPRVVAPAPAERQLDLGGARFELPGRRYHLFTGPLDEAMRFGSWITADWFEPRSPNLFWPDDRAWCVATEIDFDSTLVGGPAELVADVLGCGDLEAWPVRPDDSLAWDGDEVNRS